jgi:hypothetical protein
LYVIVFPFESVMVPVPEIEPGPFRVAVPCQVEVAPLGLVAEPLTVAVLFEGFQVRWDCQFPVPPAAFVHVPCLFTVPLERVVVEEAVPEPPLLVVYVPLRVTVVASSARAGLENARTEPARRAAAANLNRDGVFMRGDDGLMVFVSAA